jgi:hypothetical protein
MKRHIDRFSRKCEEVGCNNPAVYNISGRKLCAEHYDIYKSGEGLKEED